MLQSENCSNITDAKVERELPVVRIRVFSYILCILKERTELKTNDIREQKCPQRR